MQLKTILIIRCNGESYTVKFEKYGKYDLTSLIDCQLSYQFNQEEKNHYDNM